MTQQIKKDPCFDHWILLCVLNPCDARLRLRYDTQTTYAAPVLYSRYIDNDTEKEKG